MSHRLPDDAASTYLSPWVRLPALLFSLLFDVIILGGVFPAVHYRGHQSEGT